MEIISIHSLRMEGDRLVDGFRQTIEGFQSTPSAWRETGLYDAFYGKKTNFNPLPPHGGRRQQFRRSQSMFHFNPLPPHGGRLCDLVLFSPLYISFQSTPSAWRETRSPVLSLDLDPISIHSLRLVGDAIPIRDAPDAYFSLHSLRMEVDDRLSITTICRICISIHSLRMEGD